MAQSKVQFGYRRNPDQDRPGTAPAEHAVVVVGAGPVGLSLAIDLAQRGQKVVLLDDADRIGEGSRAICFSKRALEYWDRLGVGERMVEKGVVWSVGKIFHGASQLYQFNLLPEEGHKRPAFINLQQFYAEAYLVDLKMLAALQDDGRLTNQQLADLVGLSASQCSRRRIRLEEEKVIFDYHADLSGEALGFNLIAFVQVTLATHSPDNAKKFRALVGRVEEIQEAYSLTGDADYVLKVVLRDLKSLSNLVNDVLMPHQSVAHVRSSIVLDRLKESTKLPLRGALG